MSLDDLMKDLQKDYLNGLPKKQIRLQALVENSDVSGFLGELHKLKGTGKTYGIPELSQIAETAEIKINADNLADLGPLTLDLIEKTKIHRSEGQAFDVTTNPNFLKLANS